jgi:hypothetical protein
MSTSMAQTAGMRRFAMTAMLTIFMTAICTTCTGIMLTSISSRSAPRTPCTAPPKSGAQATSTVRTADTKPSRTVIISITSSTDGSITHMAIIATTTGLCGWSEIDTTELSEPFGKVPFMLNGLPRTVFSMRG